MIIYVLDGLAEAGNSIIVGVQKENDVYDITQIHSNKICRNELLMHHCIAYLDCTLHGSALVVAPVLSDTVDMTKVKHIDTSNYDQIEEKLLTTFIDMNDGAIRPESYISFSDIRGTDAAKSAYWSAIIEQEQDYIITTKQNGREVVRAFCREGKSYTAFQIISNNDASKELELLTRAQLELNVFTSIGTTFAFVCVPNFAELQAFSIIPQDAILASLIPCDSQNYMTTGIPADIISNTKLPSFKKITGDDAAVANVNALHKTRIYTITDGDSTVFYGARLDGTYVSALDVVRIPYTYDRILEELDATSLKAIFSSATESDGKICIKLIIPPVCLESENVVFRNASELQQCDAYKKLEGDYLVLTESGIFLPKVTDDIMKASLQGYSLSKFLISDGDDLARDIYTDALTAYYPNLRTEAQAHPTDLLSMSLPTYQQLVPIYASEDTQMTGDGVDETAYFTGKDTQNSALGTFTDYSQLDMPIDTAHFNLSSVFPYYDCVDYKSAIKLTKSGVRPELIAGDPANNKLGIQSNELQMFMGLRNLIIYGLCAENNLFTVSEVSSALESGKHSKIVDAFLMNMTEDAYALNWKHTGHVVTAAHEEEVIDEDNETEETLTSEIPGYYTLVLDEKSNTYSKQGTPMNTEDILGIVNGLRVIEAYVTNYVTNPFAWAEVVIRLLRWGARKPSALYVTTIAGTPHYLDMQSLITSTFSGNYTDLTPNVYDGGIEATVGYGIKLDLTDVGVIDTLNENLQTELQAPAEVPVGIALAKSYEDSTVMTYRYIDIFTLASEIAAGTLSVYGITYDAETESFSCATDNLIIKETIDDESDYAVYTPDKYYSDRRDLFASMSELRSADAQFTQAKCKYLAKYLHVIAGRLTNFKSYELSVFNLLQQCASTVNWQCIADFEELLSIADNTERNAALNELKTTYGIMDATAQLEKIIFRTAVRPFMQLASKVTQSSTLAEVLNTALVVLNEMNNANSNAQQAGHKTNAEFKRAFESCVSFMYITNPFTKEVICYVTNVTTPAGMKVLLFTPDEVKIPETAKTSEVNFASFVKQFVQPFAALQPSVLSKILQERFVLNDINTYLTIRNKCIEVVKQHRASK